MVIEARSAPHLSNVTWPARNMHPSRADCGYRLAEAEGADVKKVDDTSHSWYLVAWTTNQRYVGGRQGRDRE